MLLPFALALATATPVPVQEVTGFSPARAWSLGYGDAPRFPLVADLQGNGSSAIVSVNPDGEGFIDADLGRDGQKAAGGVNILGSFGKGCQAATAGNLPGSGKAVVFGLFGTSINVGQDLKEGKMTKLPDWIKLPKPLMAPELSLVNGGKTLIAFSSAGGNGYTIDTVSKDLKPVTVPKGLVWVGDEGDQLVGQKKDGSIFWIDRASFKLKSKLGDESKNSRPAAANGIVVFGHQVWTPKGVFKLSKENYPETDTVYGLGTNDSSGRPVLYEFRQGNDYYKGGLILKRRARTKRDEVADIPFEASEAYWNDSGNDGLLDGWKMSGFRGLDLKALGCTPGHADVICLVSLFDDVDRKRVDTDMKKIIQFYADLKIPNADGTTGIRFHPIFLDTVKGDDKSKPWWANRDKFLPAKWRGVVHWMQITNGGGGQANELADGGTCGIGALWAVFVHEFGHQLGLNHEGFMNVGASPIYTSLMNYTWSYSFEETRDKVHYSNGELSSFKMREDDLDETLPFPYEKVKFLSMAPYHFRMKPNGNTTLIDWNWDGVFGEKHVKANINYAYSITAGVRDTITKTKTAPYIFSHQNKLFVLFGTNDLPVDLKVQPTITPTRPGRLLLKRMQKPTVWDKEWTIESEGLTGDPVAVSFGKKIVSVYPTAGGLQMRSIEIGPTGPLPSTAMTIATDQTLVPTIGLYNGKCYIFTWNPTSHEVAYWTMSGSGKLSQLKKLDVPSSNPVGLCYDKYSKRAIIGLTQDQPEGKTNRWQIRYYNANRDGELVASGSPEWIEGEKGGARGNGRVTVLFDSTRDAGPKGRVLFYCKGITDEKTPWSCAYMAQQIADKSYNGGWIVKRFYDEWSQTRSAPAAAWFGDDIMYAYRWTAGDQSESDNNFQIAYHGLGVEPGTMTDFDDISYVRNFGLANSILNLSAAP